jgi:hypothetical protein
VIRFEGFDAKSWHRLVTLLAPGLASRPPHARSLRQRAPGGLLLLVLRDEQVLYAMHSHRGPCEVERWEGAHAMQALAQQHDARFVLALQERALQVLLDRWGARVDPDEPAHEAWLLLLDALREAVDEGRVVFWPKLVPGGLPRPTGTVLETTAELLLPSGRSAFALLFREDASLDAAIVIARPVGAPLTVLGSERVVAAVGPLSGEPRADGLRVRAWLERELGPVHFGLHTRTSALEALLRSEQPGAWSRAFNDGLLRIDPTPPWVVAALGADLARSALFVARSALGTLVDRVAPAFESATRLAQARSTLSGLLGLDVGELLGSVLRRSSPSSPAQDDDTD